MALGPRKFRRILVGLALLVVGLVGIGALGYRLGWHHRGFDAEQLARLQADWEHLIELANEPRPPTVDLGATQGHAALHSRLDAWASRFEFSASVDAEHASELLDLLRAHPAAVPLRADGSPAGLTYLHAPFEAALSDPDLPPEDLARLAGLARRLQALDGLVPFTMGEGFLEMVLDHVESDPALLASRAAALESVPAPRPDEIFLALCRRTVQVELELRESAQDSAAPPGGRGPASSATATRTDLSFLDRALLRADLDRLLDLEPLRDTPDRWATIRTPDPPDDFATWWAVETQDPVGTARAFAAMRPRHEPEQGHRWAALVDRWQRLVGN